MIETLAELGQTLAGVLLFGLFLLAPGYLIAVSLNLFGVCRRSVAEQALWAVALSVPLALLLAELLGRALSSQATAICFLLFDVLAVAVGIRERRRSRADNPRGTVLVALVAIGLVAYVVLGTLDIGVGSRLFAPTVLTDWSVRVPMIVGAASHGVPPPNPLSALGGQPAPLRYYYFWYVLCAQLVRLFHLQPEAVLGASAAWAALTLLATALLSFHYLAGVHEFTPRRVGLMLLPFAVIGLDALHAAGELFRRHPQLSADLEWWRGDRTPGLLTSLLFSPHHTAGLCCCVAAMLVLVESCGRDPAHNVSSSSASGNGPQLFSVAALAGRAVLVGCFFAACVGTSTFLTFIFVGVCFLWAADLLRTRQRSALAVLLGGGAVAWILSRPYLRELRVGSSAAKGFATLAERSNAGAAGFQAAHHLFLHHPLAGAILRQAHMLTFDFLELGFFFFVLLDRVRWELWPALKPALREHTLRLRAGQRALWIMLLGGGFFALFVSSSVTQSENDLGMHAGMLVRFVLQIWSFEFLTRMLAQRPEPVRATLGDKFLRWAAVACLIVGCIGTAANILLERLYLPIQEAHILGTPAMELVADRLSYHLFDIQAGWRWMDDHTLRDARVQFNPGSPMQPVLSFFSRRQIVASDLGCGTAFGGNYAACAPVISQLRQLYGGFPGEERADRYNHMEPPPRPETTANLDDFNRVCQHEHIGYLIAEITDPVWDQASSWIWMGRPVFANGAVRVFRCPTRD